MTNTNKTRKRLTKAERHERAQSYMTGRLNCIADCGRYGKVFEVLIRLALNPRTTVLQCAPQGEADIIKTTINGKRVDIETKTGGGSIAYNLPTAEFDNSIFKSDYYIYNPFYSQTQDLTETYVFTRAAFMDFLINSPGTWYKIEKNGNLFKVKIQNFFTAKSRKSVSSREQYFRDIEDYILSNEGSAWYLSEFIEEFITG